MRQILLISEDKVKTLSNLDSNVFGKWLMPAIREAQDINLQSIIGSCLYNHLLSLVESGEIMSHSNELYKDLLDNQIRDFLVYQTLVNIVPLINVNMANMGTVVSNDEHIQTLSQGNIDLVRNYYQSKADFYQKRLQDYLCCNQEFFPELNECGCNCTIKPNLKSNTNSTGLWLGGLRNPRKKTANDGCCGGNSSHSGGGTGDRYAEGYIDGRDYQKSLLATTAFTENGEYLRENGWSGVTVNVPQTGYTQDDLDDAYQSGKTDQKHLMVATAFTENGVYARENGYSAVTVNVPTGETINNQDKQVEITENTVTTLTYDSGYTGLGEVSINVNVPDRYVNGFNAGRQAQRNLMTTTAFTENGEYLRENGWSGVTVNVPQTGATINNQDKTVSITANTATTLTCDSGYTGLGEVSININVPDRYDEGYSSGETHQKNLLTTTAFTQNGTYTRANGWSGVTVNVPTNINFHKLTIDFSTSDRLSGLTNEAMVFVRQDGGELVSYTYTGSNIEIDLLPGVGVSVNYGDVSHYTTPSGITFDTTWGGQTTLRPKYTYEVSNISVIPSSNNLHYNAQTLTLTVTSNTGWTITDYPNWAVPSVTASTGDATVEVTLPENDGDERRGYLNFSTVDGVTASVYIRQGFKPDSFDITPTSLVFQYSGGTSALTITTNLSWEVTSKPSWATLSVTAGTGNATINVSVNSNNSYREEPIRISYSDTYIDVMVSQLEDYLPKGNTSDYLTLTALTSGKLRFYSDGPGSGVQRYFWMSVNGGKWTQQHSSPRPAPYVNLNAGDVVRLSANICYQFSCTLFGLNFGAEEGLTYNLEGNIMSMISRNNFSNLTSLNYDDALLGVFSGNHNDTGCGLVDASRVLLPATTLGTGCYQALFATQRLLTKAPELPATTLADSCYRYMFRDCSSLNYVKCLATDISASNCTGDWLDGVASNGTFVKNSSMANWTTGINGIPTNWTIQNA